ncbi:MAG: hypothetical protein K0S74_85 [Chlamydiales bacterium]|jgi:hypothetical protein|nr:hypothetical protein [Chlamydiales bacterium]
MTTPINKKTNLPDSTTNVVQARLNSPISDKTVSIFSKKPTTLNSQENSPKKGEQRSIQRYTVSNLNPKLSEKQIKALNSQLYTSQPVWEAIKRVGKADDQKECDCDINFLENCLDAPAFVIYQNSIKVVLIENFERLELIEKMKNLIEKCKLDHSFEKVKSLGKQRLTPEKFDKIFEQKPTNDLPFLEPFPSVKQEAIDELPPLEPFPFIKKENP